MHPIGQKLFGYRLHAIILLGAITPLVLIFSWIGSGSPPDFKYFWDAGFSVLHGKSWHSTWFPYPPQALALFVPFALLPVWPAYVLFDALGLLCFYFASKPYLPDDFPKFAGVLTPAALYCLFYGQTGLLVGALWLTAFRGNWLSVALLTIKPHIGVLSVLSLNRTTIVPTAVVVIVISCSAALVFGETKAFAESVIGQASAIGINTKWRYVGVGPAIGYGPIGWLAFGAAAAALLAFNVNAFTAATAALLIAPYAFHYDMPAASLGFLIALQKERSPVRAFVFMIALFTPSLVRFGAWIAPPILLCALWCYNSDQCARTIRAWAQRSRRTQHIA